MDLIYIFVGGGLGSICRYGISRLALQWNHPLPLGTIIANILACLALGLVVGWSMKSSEHRVAQLLFAVGFCGGFSTFSTFSLENVTLWQNGAYGTAMLNMAISVVICFVCVLAGIKLGSAW
ncbi:MAG: fluoride efflux transporter CrcB [Saprospiraceae bacterium]|nr:fluoride efflux transporter CrcB [Saprospiraceae bacterium]